ncbi:Proline dehydrogenase / Delta-1-pyrroline-5-carboxylate dehydrogenase [hydrothermal vent metagenome]|uniref:L-glutamate gamma-semialdehyde dehydrogenase n=1 Tax=hydrothermal vent metagenome TaxID=652676 RepID=A0A3B0YHA4_9ZZZZ
MSAQYKMTEPLQQQVKNCGKELSDAIPDTATHRAQPHKWLDTLIGQTMSDAEFRIQALRFIDVLPSLNDDNELTEHLQEYFSELNLPSIAKWGLKQTNKAWNPSIAAPTVRYTLRGLSRKFMGGSQLHHALTTISRLRHQGMNFTLDLLGEATISEHECDDYQQHYLHLMQNLCEPLNNWQDRPLLDTSNQQTSPRLNLSIKLSSLYSQIKACAPEQSIQQICKKLRPVLRTAIKKNCFITIDMEQYDFKHIVLGCFRKIIMEDEFVSWPHIGLAMQAYLKDTQDDIKSLLKLLKQRKTPVTIRLVRGAYWDYETVIARQNNWPSPVWEHKNDTDYNYEACLQLLLTSMPLVHTAIATHNPRSIAYAMALVRQYNIQSDQFEFQMLYGMSDSLKTALVKLNYRLRVYVPFGETLPGMAYLVRRLLENSSGQNMLESGLTNKTASLKDYNFYAPSPSDENILFKPVSTAVFTNTPLLRFTCHQQRDSFSATLNKVKELFGQNYPLYINGREIFSDSIIQSFNPSVTTELIGQVSSATQKHADLALASANKSFEQWSLTPAKIRADYLRRVATLLEKNRMEFSAWLIYEAGKNWTEADADVCEAIDFLNYYAQQAERIANGTTTSISGEINQTSYKPRGVSLVISPWNFPLAILCGMLSASIVSGNTCIVKPSSLTPVIAAKFIQLWKDVELPDGVINFLPGSGQTIGHYLATKPDIHIIAFTGSLETGCELLKTGAIIQPGQRHIKKVIAEMGGKNAIIIDSDADLDDAISGSLFSAFSFQGQKCSAASRIIVVASIYDRFIHRLLYAAKSLTCENPEFAHSFIGPVINKEAFSRIIQSISDAKKLYNFDYYDANENSNENAHEKNIIKPCIFFNVDPLSPLAQEEIFAPLLAVIKADSYNHAIELANNTRYALTGGVYSRQPSHLQYARQHFNVGNLYLNRSITGAQVARQPFGGFCMSGVGNKAGGEEYLLQFMHAYCVTENTLRRGFAPEIT